jgi:hypothetical protein
MDLRTTAWDGARHSLTHEEFDSCQHITRIGRPRCWIPAFTSNEIQFKSVLVTATVRWIFRSKKVPKNIGLDLACLQELATARQKHEVAHAAVSSCAFWNSMMGHLDAVESCGGYMALVAGAMYRAWRLGWRDAEVAAELNIKSHAVETILHRAVAIARELGYPAYPPRKTKRIYAPFNVEGARAASRRGTAKWRAKQNREEYLAARRQKYALDKVREKHPPHFLGTVEAPTQCQP